MADSATPLRRERIINFLKRVAPFSVIDHGTRLSDTGSVIECSRAGSVVRGIVREGSLSLDESNSTETTHAVSLDVLSGQEIEATCSCSNQDEMREQWCAHAVALLLRAADLGFAESDGGFAAQESVYRTNLLRPEDIAAVIAEVARTEVVPSLGAPPRPHVALLIDHASDRLGVQVQFNGQVQEPTIFEGMSQPSGRALDNIFLSILDEEGSWDEESKQWYINSSHDIEIALGLAREYDEVRSRQSGELLKFSESALDATLRITWLEKGAELEMHWVLPDGTTRPKAHDLIGTGPFWIVLDGKVHRLSPTAARIASIFPYSSQITLTRSQIGPVLATLSTTLPDPKRVQVINAELQPETRIVSPKPCLELERWERATEHFSSNQQIHLYATLDFEYPCAGDGENLVYLPDRNAERGYTDALKSLGFEFSAERKRFEIEGDAALDVIAEGEKLFPAPWNVTGLEGVRKGVRFAQLVVNVSLSKGSESREQRRGTPDWFDCHVGLSQNNANIPLSALFKNVRHDQDRWVRLDSGAFARIPGGGAQHLKSTLGMLDPNFRLSNSIKARLTPAQAISFCRVEDEQIQIGLDSHLKSLARRLRDFKNIPMVDQSKGFKGHLRSYQVEGLSWLAFLREFNLGGILADEMGLGKTVQTLALLQHLVDQAPRAKPASAKAPSKKKQAPRVPPSGPHLIVAPTSVIMNWAYEARRFTPRLKVLLLHGPHRKAFFGEVSSYDIVITSYALLRIDRSELERIAFDYVILDEAQNIKNPHAATTRAAKALRSHHRLALTGTPTENRPLELWSIIDFLMPGYLGSVDFFRTHIERPLLEGGASVQVAKFLNSKTRPFILRRMKAEVERELPPKIESTLHVVMTDSQRSLYNQILEEVRPRVFDAVSKKGVRGASVSILAALLRLRQVCNHPNSIEALREVDGFDSGKFDLLQELVEEAVQNGRKVLLFSQFKEMLAIMRRWLDKIEIRYEYLDGATRNRQEIIDRFSLDESVRLFLISLKAGGTGLNLAAADTVILYDPWWNPAVESQAVDRAHRIGQRRTVNVYRLVTENSIEQKIMDLKAKKSRLIDALVNENGLTTLNLTKADLENLFAPIGPEVASL